MAESFKKIVGCDHYLIEVDGMSVCNLCGKVENMFTFENDVTMKNHNIFKINKINNFAEELYSRDIISSNVLSDANFFIKQWKNEKIPFKNYHEIYAIYHSAKYNDFPLTLKELAYFSGVSIKNFCKVEKFLKKNILSSKFTFLEKYCKLLNLTYVDEKIVKTKINEISEKISDTPSNITAAAITLVFRQLDKEKIARATGVTKTAINKVVKNFIIRSAKMV